MNDVGYFRKKPVVVQAIRWLGNNVGEILEWCPEKYKHKISVRGDSLIIPTLEGDMEASKGDWIIKGISGEIYPCKPDIFEQTYEPVIP